MPPKPAAGGGGKAAQPPKCPIKGCNVRLSPQFIAQCKTCHKDFCKEHYFPGDHDCQRLSGGMSRSASTPNVAAAKAPGIQVLSTVKPAAAVVAAAPANGNAAPAAAAAKFDTSKLKDSAAILNSLLASPPSSTPSSPLFDALSNPSAEIRAAGLECGKEVVRALGGASDKAAQLVSALLVVIDIQAQRPNTIGKSSSMPTLAKSGSSAALAEAVEPTKEDWLRAGTVRLLSLIVDAFSSDAGKVTAIAHHLVAVGCLPSGQDVLGTAVADALSGAAKAFQGAEAADFVKTIFGQFENTRLAAFPLAGAVSGLGVRSLVDHNVTSTLRAFIEDKAASVPREAALFACQLLASRLGRTFEPYVPQFMTLALACLGENQANVRDAADSCCQAFANSMAPSGVGLLIPPILVALGDRAWKKRETALQLISLLSLRAPKQMAKQLPAIIPVLMDCLQDTHPKVAAAGSSALKAVAQIIEQPEIQKNMANLTEALTKPDQKTNACLEKLMETTFCNPMDCSALAVVVPVVARGLRERSAELKKIAAMTAGNIFALVQNPRDMKPFVPVILPEVAKACEHSHPDVRKAAERAKEKLLSGAQMEGGAGAAAAGGAADDKEGPVAARVREHLRGRVPEAVAEFAAEEASLLLEEGLVTGEGELEEIIGPVVAGYLDAAAAAALCEEAVRAFRESRGAGSDEHAGKDLLVHIPNIILAFAGRVLMNKTSFYLERGHCYGLVGQNGVGKTTLLTRVASGDINGWPKHVSIYFIEHEILAEEGTSVLDFMLSQVPEGCSQDTVRAALVDVGFNDARMNAAVSELSGGWRMKLAIARSMLWNADLLLLDEPTNHLDVGAIEWLVKYIRNLKCTVCLVSHDYDFLSEVLTDVIHIADSKLTYYPIGFREFQRVRPEIVAGLPSPANAVKHAAAVMEGKVAAGSAVDLAGMASAGSSAVDLTALANGSGNGNGHAEENGHAANGAPEEPKAAIHTIAPLKFPDPGPLDGIKNRLKPVMKMTNVAFKYETAAVPILRDVTVRLTLSSRAALVGLNGAGKTTLLKLLVGDLEPADGVGEVWKHHNLRLAYIAQHSMHHLEEHVESTPLAYIQDRFYLGRDKELSKLSTLAFTEEDKADMNGGRGEIAEIIGRAERGGKGQLWYEVRKVGRKDNDTSWEPLDFLKKMKPYVLKMVKNYDEKMKAMASGVDIRPLTVEEVKAHLADFGINEDLAMGKIRRMSGGQKSRLVLAAAMWGKPHLIALDEPTNYLDNDTLAALTKALQDFKGGVITISHNEAFVAQLCSELWHVGEGVVRMENLKEEKKAAEKAAKAGK